MKARPLERSFVRQQDQADCGIACLLSVINYHGGAAALDELRRTSGTNRNGTTLLGLLQCAREQGFDADGCTGDTEALMTQTGPVILHIHTELQTQHYVVCYGTTQKDGDTGFLIGDPAAGILVMSAGQLEKQWVSRACLVLHPNTAFRKKAGIQKARRSWVHHLLKEDFPLLAIAAGLGLVIAALGLVMAIFSQHLLDEILPSRQMTRLCISVALVFVLLIVKEALSWLRGLFLLRQSRQFNIRIIDHFYTRLLRLPKPFFDGRSTGDLTARLNDTARIQRIISQLAGSIVTDSLVTLIGLGFLCSYSLITGLAALLALPVYFFLIYRSHKPILRGQQAIMSRYAATESYYISTLQGIAPIKSFSKQPLFAGVNRRIYQDYQQAVFSLGGIQVRLSFVANSFGAAFLLAVLLYSGIAVIDGKMKSGELMAMVSMCTVLLPCIANLALTAIPIGEAKIAFDRMFEFTGIAPETEAGDHHGDHQHISADSFTIDSLSITGLSFRFAGRPQLLREISLSIRKGEIIALMGENGSGKSTLAAILQRHYSWESGTITINGTPIHGTPGHSFPVHSTGARQGIAVTDIPLPVWRKAVGVVPQNVHIFNASVLENIAFDDATEKPAAVIQFLQEWGFLAFFEAMPQSVLTTIGEAGVNISGGQRQMIAMARALYQQPQLLIMDEGTAAMDRSAEQFVFRLLEKLRPRLAVILITHRLHTLWKLADRLYVIESGRITAHGDHQALLLEDNLYSRYWGDIALATQ